MGKWNLFLRLFSRGDVFASSKGNCRNGLLLEVMWVNQGVAMLAAPSGKRAVVKSVERDPFSGRDIINVWWEDKHSLDTGFTGPESPVKAGLVQLGSPESNLLDHSEGNLKLTFRSDGEHENGLV